MAGLQAGISYGCNSSGQGFFRVDSLSIINQGIATVTFNSDTNNFSLSFPPTTLPYTIIVPSGSYEIECWQGTTKGTVRINGVTLSTAAIDIDCFVCDLVLNTVATTNATAPAANGTATLTASGTHGAKQYSLNGSTWQTSNVFSGIATGNYTAYVRYQAYPSCISSKTFTIKPVPVYGCTNPEASNYNPDANTDDGTCVFIPQYHATGGTMPNPVWIEKDFIPFTGFPPKLKTKHYVTLNLYEIGSIIPFATKIVRVRNGSIKADISKDLQIGKLNLSILNQLISTDENALFPFEIGFIESYDNRSFNETRLSYPKRIAVRAALPKADDAIISNVLLRIPNAEAIEQAEFISAFEVPVKFADEPVCLSILIDDSIYDEGGNYKPVFLERSYFDSQKRLVQRISTQVFDSGFVRFEINDTVLPCVSYMEACLNSEFREQEGDCLDEVITPPEVLPNQVQIQDGSGNVIATVNAGDVFVIESGFSFGFRIIPQ